MAETRRRQTRQRTAINDMLHATDDFVSAQQVHQMLRESGDATGLATVYRTLGAMSADGTVDVLRNDDGELLYRRCESEAHHHHLVCRHCGATVEVAGPAVEKWTERVAAEHGFTDVAHTLELFGVCERCRKAGAQTEAGAGTE